MQKENWGCRTDFRCGKVDSMENCRSDISRNSMSEFVMLNQRDNKYGKIYKA